MISRLFIGLDLPAEIVENLISLRNQIYGEPNDLRWESESKLHVTVKFLGDVGENVSALLTQRLGELEIRKMVCKFDSFAFFKKSGSLKILFASLYNTEKLKEFHEIIEEECELIGFQREKRKFYPHITLLRLKGKEDIKRLLKFNKYNIDNPDFEISSFSLIKSELKPSGSEYSIVQSFKLF
jgi:2'-5' RNA ligase